MEISKNQIKEKISLYEDKLKKLRKLCYNESIKTNFELEINSNGGVNFDELKCSMHNSDGEDFNDFIRFLSDGDIIEIKLKSIDNQ